ncbi:hypothetical protein AVEN_235471-1 [Araneus ventricosus]|uniref:EF-hand domain-containing protein n=1 Tax=Araneus ventricosus TaxID=182803 RepID=A0A4Y2A438_ARAVE|nr:hypothetical protein AVEN_235471-1 [Araneus ventricosus]
MRYNLAFKILVVLFIVDSCKAFHIPHEPHLLTSNSPLDERHHIHHHINAVSEQDIHQMTKDELEFLYFKMYDSDNNDKLDGCEIMQSLFHWHIEGQDGVHANISTGTIRIFRSEELIILVDPILESRDKNMDGFISFSEYVLAEVSRVEQRNSENGQSV